MRVCYFGTYEKDYPRNHVLIDGLKKEGVDVVECHFPLWEKEEHKTRLSILGKIKIAAMMPYAYFSLMLKLRKLMKKKDVDCIIVGYIGQIDMFFARLFALKEKIIFNPMISLYDTLVNDRKLIKNSLLKKIIHYFEKKSCSLADLVVLDTEEHANYFKNQFNIKKTGVLYIGADKIFKPMKKTKRDKHIEVLYYGKYTPLQGTRYVIESAKLLEKHKEIYFEIVGIGQTYEEDLAFARKIGVKNIKFTRWVDYKKLPKKIAEADICLGGHFGKGKKALRVVPNKVFQMIAMAKPVVVNGGPAMKNAGFKHNVNCLFADIADPKSIAKAVVALENDGGLRKKIGDEAYGLYKKRFSEAEIAKKLIKHIKSIGKEI
ncbi:glycosyltransferase [candidate division KSB1 bacterium]